MIKRLPSISIYFVAGVILFLFGITGIATQGISESYTFFFSLIPLTYWYVEDYLHKDIKGKEIRNKTIIISYFSSLVTIPLLIGIQEYYSVNSLLVIFAVLTVSFCGAFIYYAKRI